MAAMLAVLLQALHPVQVVHAAAAAGVPGSSHHCMGAMDAGAEASDEATPPDEDHHHGHGGTCCGCAACCPDFGLLRGPGVLPAPGCETVSLPFLATNERTWSPLRTAPRARSPPAFS